MRVSARLHSWLRDAQVWCHLARYRAVLFAVEALLGGGVLTVSGLGRSSAACRVAAKHRIKRVDRLVGNGGLHRQIDAFSQMLAKKLLGYSKEPVLLVDWTHLWGAYYALTAAVPYEGRALLVYWEIHRERFLNRASVHKRFLKKLYGVIPASCTPVVTTDAGFHSPWFITVRQLGWHYVGRVRAQVKCTQNDGSWVEVRSYHASAKTKPRDLGHFVVSKSNPIEHRLVLVRQRQKPGPKRRRLTHKLKPGGRRKTAKDTALSLTAQANKSRNAAIEPWVLATSLDHAPSNIVGIYKRRMQTEETYRHLKSSRGGWHLGQSKSRTPARLRTLLLIAALAASFLMVVGILAEDRKLHLRYQANTTTKRRVLSLLFLAQLVVRENAIEAPPGAIRAAIAKISTATEATP